MAVGLTVSSIHTPNAFKKVPNSQKPANSSENVDQWQWQTKKTTQKDNHLLANEIRKQLSSQSQISDFFLNDLVQSMDEFGFEPDRSLSVQLLNGCSSYESGKIVRKFLGKIKPSILIDAAVFSKLIGMYLRFGKLDDAGQVFDEMTEKDSVLWSVFVTACCQYGYFLEALEFFRKMRIEGYDVDEFALGSCLKASGEITDVWVGRQIHALSIVSRFDLDVCVRTALITMYSKCLDVLESEKFFRGIRERDVTCWNAMLAAYVYNKYYEECLYLFVEMISSSSLVPTEPTYASLINACASVVELGFGTALHGFVVKYGFVNTILGNSLVTFYAKCGRLDDAMKMFMKVPQKSTVTWNAMVAAYEQNNRFFESIDVFRKMQGLGMKPNKVTVLSIMKAVYSLEALEQGKELHAWIGRHGLTDDVLIANSLMTLYSKCGRMHEAEVVFKGILIPDTVSWNAMLSGYIQNHQEEQAFKLFKGMRSAGICPDGHTSTIILSSPYMLKNVCRCSGREFHIDVIKAGGTTDICISNALITMYANCGKSREAERVFDRMIKKDLYSWNALMVAYSINDLSDKAIELFLDMQRLGLKHDHLTLSILLTSCSRLVSLELGRQFHALIIKTHCHVDHCPSSLSICNSLISAYAKCGSIIDASRVFKRMLQKDIISWTAMLTGYAQHGMGRECLKLFENMKRDRIRPNSVTFLSVMTACAHTGLVEEGIHYFGTMTNDYDIKPDIEHYACVVDLYGRSGQLENARRFIEGIPFDHGTTLWKVLLGACHAHKALDLGSQAAKRILDLDPEDETVHVLLSNIYARYGKWEDAVNIRKKMKERGLKKEPGLSWIEIENRRHCFTAADMLHPDRSEIYVKVKEIDREVKSVGYSPLTELVLHDVDEQVKETIVGHHSEKLAVSFGLLRSPPGKIIRVIKNLRVCEDCHNWLCLVSVVERREFIVRDSRRFHSFRDGRCTCGDYW